MHTEKRAAKSLDDECSGPCGTAAEIGFAGGISNLVESPPLCGKR
jgi:hypothetical protein